MKLLTHHKLLSGGIALSLILGGGAVYAYAADNGTGAAAAPASNQQKQEGAHQGQHHAMHGAYNKANGQLAGKRQAMKEKAEVSLKSLADILGMKPEEIKAELKKGKSLADLAAAKGIAKDDLVAKLNAGAVQKIDAAVKAGRLTPEKADQIKQKLPERLQTIVEKKGAMLGEHGKHGHPAGGVGYRMEEWAKLIGISKDELKKQLDAGKSLAEVAGEHGISQDQLIAKMKDALTPKLEKIVTHKRGDKPDHVHKPSAGDVTTPAPSAAP